MKLQQFSVMFESVITLKVLAPEGTDVEEIRDIAKTIAEELGSDLSPWEVPEFQAIVGKGIEIDVPDEQMKRKPANKYGNSSPVEGILTRDYTLVLSDEGDDFVLPDDAEWWSETPPDSAA